MGAALVLAVVGALGGAGWYLTQTAAEAPEQPSSKRPDIASNVAAAEDREPVSDSATVIDLDQEEQSENSAEKGQPSPEPELTDAHARARSPEQAGVSGPEHSGPDSEADSSGRVVAGSPAEVEQTEVDQAGDSGDENELGTTKPEDPTSQDQLVAEAAAVVAPQPVLPPFDAQAAKAALTAKASQASSCRAGDDPRGTAEVLITFAPSGRVTSANVSGQPFGGTATGGCIASTLRGVTVPPFSGDHITVRKLVKIH